jgi:D-arabinose 1-dehydrogenase-like Zn-dependent alcohol dehydrogenase
MAKMKAVQVPKAGGDFEVVEREIPQPGPGQVRIKVQACGVCHSDVLTKEGGWPGLTYPRVPGHEVAGVIDEVGSGITAWKKGERVGVGWHGGQDGTCLQCRRGDFGNCANLKVCGIAYDGGYQEYMVAPVEALAHMPEALDAAEAGPLMCAGVTTFNALRHSGAMDWDTSESSSLRNSVIEWRRSAAERKTRPSRKSSGRTCTSIAEPLMPRRNCKSLEERA